MDRAFFYSGVVLCVLLTLCNHRSSPSKYVTLDGNPPKNYFYYIVVSENKPLQDLVVYGLTADPDALALTASSLKMAMPLRISVNDARGAFASHFIVIKYIIYLDSPAGVGFPYSPNTSLCVTGDRRNRTKTHNFLLKWFEQYLEFQASRCFIAGESYGGVHLVVNGVAYSEYDDNGL
ncbi:Peptidase S10, serine carboxypeptidase [Dillenia turbinata]|uniref:Carboxypeptidase n=1 Tax=Dillenia turbinata TaxID=194707 RepID=A0AAN8UJQ5_9MAGN